MFCLNCGNEMETLPKLYQSIGKTWLGCKSCNTVIEHNFCSTFGRDLGTTPCDLTYEEFINRMTKNKK